MIYLTLSYDHRLVDGADAARYLTTVKATWRRASSRSSSASEPHRLSSLRGAPVRNTSGRGRRRIVGTPPVGPPPPYRARSTGSPRRSPP